MDLHDRAYPLIFQVSKLTKKPPGRLGDIALVTGKYKISQSDMYYLYNTLIPQNKGMPEPIYHT